MSVIGIDLGTTNSLAAYWADGRVHFIPDENGNRMVPSAAVYLEGEGIVVGRKAKEHLLNGGEGAASFKRFMGTKKEYMLGGKAYTPMELSAMVLHKLKEQAERILPEIEEAVITVPAYFNDKQRSDTKKAAQIAGLKVERLINEPSAAALAYRMQYGSGDKSLLIFDFGGGTLDLSCVECFDNVIEITAVAGDNYLGGDDIDHLIAEYDCTRRGLDYGRLGPKEQAALLKQAEAAKCCLGGTTDDGLSLTEEQLFEICMPLFTKMKELFLHILEDAGLRVSDLDDLIMVGGSSRLPVVKRFLTELLGKEPVVLGDTDMVVALGAGIYTGIRRRDAEIRDILLTDVCPFTLGVETFRRQGEKKGYLLPMIERNSTLPASRRERLVTLYDYQTAVTVKIYQGEEYFARDNIYLGEVTAQVAPKKAGKEWIDVYFTYDINGILHVEIVNSKGEHNQILLANQTLGEAELERHKKEIEALMTPPLEQDKNRKLLERASAYYEQSAGARRERLGALIHWFVAGMNSGRLYRIRRAAEEMERQLALLEEADERREDLLFDGDLKWDLDLEDLGDDDGKDLGNSGN